MTQQPADPLLVVRDEGGRPLAGLTVTVAVWSHGGKPWAPGGGARATFTTGDDGTVVLVNTPVDCFIRGLHADRRIVGAF